jgi:hypothetical protein
VANLKIDKQDQEKVLIALQNQVGSMTRGVTVANAAGANPTAAEFLALLTSLRNANIIAP